jgi:geranylgeranyl diphosphate synthase type II
VDIFVQYRPWIDRINQCLLESVSPQLPRTLSDPINYFLNNPSKKIRPLLSIFCCEAVGGNAEDAIPAATAIELFHDFTLIHDDIMDEDDMRRGKPTIHKKWDGGTAILVGDALIGLSFQQLVKSPVNHLNEVVKIFSEALVKVCEGQALDKSFETASQVNLDNYIDMIAKKTAWLFKASCEIGTIIGGGSPLQVEQLSQYGFRLGLAFQIQDDLLDFIADESILGKKIGSDFKMDKKTYITLKYQSILNENPGLAERYPLNEADYPSLADFQKALRELGIVNAVEMEINRYFDESMNSLRKALPHVNNHPLHQISSFLHDRQY